MGWSICTDMTTPAPTPTPTPCTTSHTVVSIGECDVVVIVSKAQIIHQIVGQIGLVTFVSEAMGRFLRTISPQKLF